MSAPERRDAPIFRFSPFHFPSGQASEPSGQGLKRRRRRKPRPMMLIRRIHLFSGLFMLPWVLLYGFTALLFNHPTWMTDSKTAIEYFTLSKEDAGSLPSASSLASAAVDAANDRLAGSGGDPSIELIHPERAVFLRQAFGNIEHDQQRVSLILDLDTGKGYLRTRTLTPQVGANEAALGVSLNNGLPLQLPENPVEAVRQGVAGLLSGSGLEPGDLAFRGLPGIGFDALVDGKEKRLRLSPEPTRGRRSANGSSPSGTTDGGFAGRLTVVGQNPREMSARRFLLRLHTAHGYPVRKNSRWFWAIAVDLMFASMCFWGLSGVFMWWQIKRTRSLGLVLLVASGVVATWLAIGMHWQLVNG